MSRGNPQVQYAIPTPEPWQRNLLIALFGAYVVELVLHNLGIPLYRFLPWYNWSGNFEIWQPLTRYLVQGADRGAVVQVLLSLFVLYFFLPAMDTITDHATLLRSILAGAIGGTLVPFVLDLAGVVSGGVMGWSALVMVLPVLFGIARPDQDILLLVFPIKARWFLWGSLVIALLFILVDRSLGSFEHLGVWLGVFGWWHTLGPGRRRRDLRRQASGIERELKRFQVLDGGRSQGGQGGSDDWIH
ncbi:MAG TPA: hypothetical protein ENK18_17875 [Deltaproteobacteria bacterium]|nr:hypothetical protein [Deltaproteobacteria bacterium]